MAKKDRCGWAETSDLMQKYHDEEWGVPSHDDVYLFEMLTLEGAQVGLSWSTVLNKRDNYRRLFDDFDVLRIARYSEKRQARMLQDSGIVRNRLKVSSVVSNAQAFLRTQGEFGSFDAYLWGWVQNTPIANRVTDKTPPVATSPLSDALSKDLKKRGFRFVGSTIVYAYLQAVGVIDDHHVDCPWKIAA